MLTNEYPNPPLKRIYNFLQLLFRRPLSSREPLTTQFAIELPKQIHDSWNTHSLPTDHIGNCERFVVLRRKVCIKDVETTQVSDGRRNE